MARNGRELGRLLEGQLMAMLNLQDQRGRKRPSAKPMTPIEQTAHDKMVEEWQDRAQRNDPDYQCPEHERKRQEERSEWVRSLVTLQENGSPEDRSWATGVLNQLAGGGARGFAAFEEQCRSDPSR